MGVNHPLGATEEAWLNQRKYGFVEFRKRGRVSLVNGKEEHSRWRKQFERDGKGRQCLPSQGYGACLGGYNGPHGHNPGEVSLALSKAGGGNVH